MSMPPEVIYNPFTDNLDFTGQVTPPTVISIITNNGTATDINGVLQLIVLTSGQGATVTTSVLGPSNEVNLNLTDSSDNIFIGRVAGNNSYTGASNTGIGTAVFQNLTSGNFNTALGQIALNSITTGSGNVAIGFTALTGLTTASNNVAIGQGAMTQDVGANNTAIGFNSLTHLVGGANNIAIGYTAGQSYVGTESSNILIGHLGIATESNVIRLGTDGSGSGQQNECFIAGIQGSIVASSSVVGVDASGQLSNLGTGTLGQVFTSTGTSSPVWQNPNGLLWQVNTTTPITVALNNGYIANEASATLIYNLPAIAAIGSTVSVTNISATQQWQIQANTGQIITLGTVSSTSGGTATSMQNGDTVTLICTVANTNWQIISSIGNIILA